MKITVCIGSYCHLKGSRTVAELLRGRIAESEKRAQMQQEHLVLKEKY